jgi:hypothetical protein
MERPAPEDELDERDPKERASAEHDAPAVAESSEEFEGDFADDGPDEAAAEAGPVEPGIRAEGGPGIEPFRRRRRRRRRRGRARYGLVPAEGAAPLGEVAPVEAGGRREPHPQAAPSVAVTGILKLHGDHSGLLVSSKELFAERGDSFLPKHLIEAEDLEEGLLIEAEAVSRGPKGPSVQRIVSVEGMPAADYRSKYVQFHKGISVDPDRRLRM